MEETQLKKLYLEYRRLLFSLAYRMLGTVSDAEDLVQDIFVQLSGMELAHDRNIKSLLCTMTTHRCIDVLKSARKKRECYVGPWLPEPIVSTEEDPLEEVIQGEYVSIAIMVVLEQLTPMERVVFVLREVMDFDYPTIAQMLGKEEVNCRKIFSRTKKKISSTTKIVNKEKKAQNEELVRSFMTALGNGNIQVLLDILAPDVTYMGDGTIPYPVYTRELVSKLIIGIGTKLTDQHVFTLTNVNGEPGFVVTFEGKLLAVVGFHLEEEKIKQIFVIFNPVKLQHLKNEG